MLRFGKISKIDAAKGLYQVTFDEDKLVSGWIHGAVKNSKLNKNENPFSLNEHVACLMDSEMKFGVVFCSIYDTQNLPEFASEHESGTTYQNGSYYKVNKQTGKVEAAFNEIKLNGGSNGGVPKVDPLVQKINALENKLNNLINAIVTTWVTAPGDGGAALKVLISTLYSTTLAPTIQTNKTEIENNKFLQ